MRRSPFGRKQQLLQKLLAEGRRQAGLTQVSLAKTLGRPQSYVSKFERGERRLDVVEFLEVARAISVDPARILASLEKR